MTDKNLTPEEIANKLIENSEPLVNKTVSDFYQFTPDDIEYIEADFPMLFIPGKPAPEKEVIRQKIDDHKDLWKSCVLTTSIFCALGIEPPSSSRIKPESVTAILKSLKLSLTNNVTEGYWSCKLVVDSDLTMIMADTSKDTLGIRVLHAILTRNDPSLDELYERTMANQAGIQAKTVDQLIN